MWTQPCEEACRLGGWSPAGNIGHDQDSEEIKGWSGNGATGLSEN